MDSPRIVLVLLAFALPLPASAGSFDDLQQQFAARKDAIHATYQSTCDEQAEGYIRSLHRLASRAPELAAIKQELDRFERVKDINPSDVVAKPIALSSLQRNLLTSLSPAKSTRDRALADADRVYLARMQKMKVELTRAGRLDEALEVAKAIAAFEELQADLPKNPQLHYGFDKEGAEIVDQGAEKIHGEPGPSTWIADGIDGGARRMPGDKESGALTSPHSPKNGTVMLWIRPSTTLDSEASETGIVDCEGRGTFFTLNWGRGGVGNHLAEGAISCVITPDKHQYATCPTMTTVWRKDTWYHLAVSWNGARQRIYVNGELENDVEQKYQHNASGLRIAGGFPGDVDEFMVWDRVLKPGEILRVAKHQRGDR